MEKKTTPSAYHESLDDITKPLHIPAHFEREAPLFDQVVFTLGYLMEGSVNDVSTKLCELNPDLRQEDAHEQVAGILEKLFVSGKISKVKLKTKIIYHLHKEVKAHTGNVDPDDITV